MTKKTTTTTKQFSGDELDAILGHSTTAQDTDETETETDVDSEEEETEETTEENEDTQAESEDKKGEEDGKTSDQEETKSDDKEEDKEKDEDKKDPDVVPDDEEIKNFGQLRSVRKRNQSLTRRLKAAEKELEDLKKSPTTSSAEDQKTIKELKDELQTFKDQAVVTDKKNALKEKGLPESYLSILKGTDEEWKATLKVLSENNKKPTPGAGGKALSNGRTPNGNGKANGAELDKMLASLH